MPEPAFYAYAAPEPAGFKTARVGPAAAFYSPDFNEFLLNTTMCGGRHRRVTHCFSFCRARTTPERHSATGTAPSWNAPPHSRKGSAADAPPATPCAHQGADDPVTRAPTRVRGKCEEGGARWAHARTPHSRGAPLLRFHPPSRPPPNPAGPTPPGLGPAARPAHGCYFVFRRSLRRVLGGTLGALPPRLCRLVSAQPRALEDAVRSGQRRGVLQPSDRAAPSDCFLRGPSAGLQLQHAGEARAWPAEHRRSSRNAVRARHRSARIVRPRRDSRFMTREQDGPPATPSGGLPPKPTGRCSMRWSTPTSTSPATRFSTAPKPPSRFSSTKRCTRKRSCICGIGCRSITSSVPQATSRRSMARFRAQEWIQVPAGRATLGLDRDALVFGWDNERSGRDRLRRRLQHRTPRRDERGLSRIRRGGRLPRFAMVASRRLGLGAGRRMSGIRSSGNGTTRRGTGAACST